MRYSELDNYVEERLKEGLSKIDVSFVVFDETSLDVAKTKETYVLYDEAEANKLIDEKRRLDGFAGVDKKFKAGKVNKAGEEISPDTWTIVVKLNW